MQGDIANPPLPWLPYLATFKQVMEKAQRRAARELQQQQTGTYSISNNNSNSNYADAGSDLVTVTVHPAGPNSKASKAAATVAATSGGVKSKAGKKQR